MSDFPYSAHIGYLFNDRPLRERIAAAKRHGFAAIEHPSPYAVPATEMAQWLREEDLPYTQFGLHSGDAQKGEKGIGIFPERREEFRRSVADGLAYAETVSATMVHAMAGVLPVASRRQEHWDCYVENLGYAAGEAGKRGITIILEAMSTSAVPHYFVETPDRAAAAISEAGGAHLGLLLDIFHTANMDLDIAETIRSHAQLIRHVHIADFPGRHEPGSGTLDFGLIGRTLADVGYAGRLGCEYVPAGRTEDGLGWLARRLASTAGPID